jgi:hypothetical protein
MARIKHMTHPISDKALPETASMAYEDVTEALSPQMEGFADVASYPGREDSSTNTSDNKNQSTDSDDTTSKSDS